MEQYLLKPFKEAMMTYFDCNDDETRRTLLACNEADQNKVLVALTGKLYDKIVDKVDDINFGTIPSTKGDITKLENFDQLVDCIKIIDDILRETGQGRMETTEVLQSVINYFVEKRDLYIRAYQLRLELPIVIYNTMVLSLYSATSVLISSCIEFIKEPNGEGFDIAVNKVALNKTKDNMLFENLKKFNKACSNGEINKAIENIIATKAKGFTGTAAMGFIAGTAAAMGIILNIIPILRELTYFFYYSRTQLADYFDAQASLLQMNAYNLANSSTKDTKEKNEIKRKQLKIADTFRKISNKLTVSTGKAEVNTNKETAKLEKELKIKDVVDEIPDSAASSLF